ncbi:MAG: benzoate-CoA ligase family protein [Gammaproteobacteria bacterium]|nr:benzoate-CoA ligase family protein [Gammaproteobacteria bacterium]
MDNGTPPGNAFTTLLARAAEPDGVDATALRYHDTSVSYRDLAERAARAGAGLARLGVQPENRVLFLMKDSPAMVAAWLGTLHIGAVAVAYNIRASAAEIRHAVTDSRCRALVVDADYLPLVREALDGLEYMPALVSDAGDVDVVPLGRLEASDLEPETPFPVRPDDMAFWIYTSGTTGKPKAVVHLHKDITIAADYMRGYMEVGSDDVIFSTSKLFFAYALGHSLLGGLSAGATVVIDDQWPDPQTILALVEKHRPTVFYSVPTLYRNLLHDGAASQPAFSCVRRFCSAGEKLPVPLFEGWLEATGKPILEGIGTSESIFFFLGNRPEAVCPGSSGKPLPWSELRLTGDDGETIEAPDFPGSLWVRMPSVGDRYWNHQAKSRATFVGEWYRTGDIYSVDADGFWHHQGRDDDMLKISGQWVYPTEIEDVAIAVDGVAETALVGATNADGLVRLHLFVVAHDGVDQDALAETIKSTATERLAIYKVPRNIHFIDAIPRTATGKARRFLLRRQVEAVGT